MRRKAWELVVCAVHARAMGDIFGEGSPVVEARHDVALVDGSIVLVDKLLDGGEVLLELD